MLLGLVTKCIFFHKKDFMKIKKTFLELADELKRPILAKQDDGDDSFVGLDGKRDDSFDVLKGVAIILVVMCHCEIGALYPFIYSFHIPLFFFVSGYFLKIRPICKEIQLSFKRLLVPYAFAAFCICVFAFLKDLSNYTWADGYFSQTTIIKYLLGFRGEIAPDFVAGGISVLWFVLAMFWARMVAVFLIGNLERVRVLPFLFFVLGILGMILENYVFVPFCIPQGLSAASCVYIGYLLRKYNVLVAVEKKIIFPFFLVLWLYSWDNHGVAMADCIFRCGFVFSIMGALGAFFVLYIMVKKAYDDKALLWCVLRLCGRYSLVIYCIHAIEKDVINWKSFALLHHVPLNFFTIFQFSSRMMLIFAFTFVVLKIKFIREEVFQIR